MNDFTEYAEYFLFVPFRSSFFSPYSVRLEAEADFYGITASFSSTLASSWVWSIGGTSRVTEVKVFIPLVPALLGHSLLLAACLTSFWKTYSSFLQLSSH